MAILYVISTPIGNLEDITFRAIDTLKNKVKTIYCEDTRVTIKLLNRFQIEGKSLVSFNKFSENKKQDLILEALNQGQDVALVSDAGTPLIADPGFLLINSLFSTEHKIVPIPGCSALSTALSVCPIDTQGFVFEGFLPHGPKQRRRVLKKLVDEIRPIVFFESPHRIKKTLEDLKIIFPSDLEVFLARELTKKFEQFYFGTLTEVTQSLETQFLSEVQGEFVLVIKSDKVVNSER